MNINHITTASAFAFISLSVAVLLGGCANPVHQKSGVVVDGYETTSDIYPAVVDSYEIVPLEQTDKCVLTGIKKIVKSDSVYIVFDNYNNLIARFDQNGKFLNRIGLSGRAASEYLRIDNFATDADGRVLIFDGSQDKVLVYEQDGGFVTSVSFPKRALGFINDAVSLGGGRVLVNNCIYNNNNDIYRVLSLTDKGIATLVEFPMISENIAEPTGKNPIGGSGRVVILKPFDGTVYTLDEQDAVVPLLSVGQSKKLVDDKYIENHNIFSIATTYAELSKDGYFPGFVSVFETEKHLLLVTYNNVYFLIDKESNLGRPLRQGFCESYDGVPLMGIVAASSDDTLIGLYLPGDFVDKYNLSEISPKLSEIAPDFVSSLTALPEEGNPCLIIYHLR